MRRLPWVLLLIAGGITILLAVVAIDLIGREPVVTEENQSPAEALLDEQADKACGLPSSESVAAQEKVAVQDNGFEPKEVTVKVGQTVRWTNTDNGPHRVISDVHPLHDDCFGLDSDELSAGEVFGYTFTKPGTWLYHDEAAIANRGQVVVTE